MDVRTQSALLMDNVLKDYARASEDFESSRQKIEGGLHNLLIRETFK